jgi:hypothetical protein
LCPQQGGSILPFYSSDGEYLFRQEAYFHYMFGANEDNVWGALDVRNVSAKQELQVQALQWHMAGWLLRW